MSMYLSNPDLHPTGYEPAEFIEPPSFGASGATENEPGAERSDIERQFLRDLDEENASIAGDIVQVGRNAWAIHGFIPVDGEILLAEFDDLDQATRFLDELRPRPGRDESR